MTTAALRSVMSYLRANILRDPNAVRIGPFLAKFDSHSANPYRNYAVPEDLAQPTAADLDALVGAFTQRGRRPRLEYVPGVAPEVLPALSDAGFTPEGELPLMICRQDALRMPTSPVGIEVLLVTSANDLAIAAGVQNRAYDEPDTTPADALRLSSLVTQGGAVAVARHGNLDQAVGSGIYSSPQQRMTEIAAVGVLEAFRGLGIATRLTACLAKEALDHGCLPFLMAASEREARLYRRVGFADCGTMLHISRRVAGRSRAP